jgi:hypothetical protein
MYIDIKIESQMPLDNIRDISTNLELNDNLYSVDFIDNQYINSDPDDKEISTLYLELIKLLYEMSWPIPPIPPKNIDIGNDIGRYIQELISKRLLVDKQNNTVRIGEEGGCTFETEKPINYADILDLLYEIQKNRNVNKKRDPTNAAAGSSNAPAS